MIRNNSHYREIGIRGDCVYAIFDTPSKGDCKDVFETAYKLNSVLHLLKQEIKNKYKITVDAGIGIGDSIDALIIKTGKPRSGIYDNVWVGDAVVDASNLSGIANRNRRKRIVMSSIFYRNVIDKLME